MPLSGTVVTTHLYLIFLRSRGWKGLHETRMWERHSDMEMHLLHTVLIFFYHKVSNLVFGNTQYIEH